MRSRVHFDINIVQDENVTMAMVEAEGFEEIIASARRHPLDDHDPLYGVVVALERLFTKMAQHYQEARRILDEVPEDLGGETAGTGAEADFWAQHEVPPQEQGF